MHRTNYIESHHITVAFKKKDQLLLCPSAIKGVFVNVQLQAQICTKAKIDPTKTANELSCCDVSMNRDALSRDF
ncbi:predicted protein [Sclerotinia sclerotiorum 1980 UF-70]|uniref:Uncharacterized protein n=1 Tax=Sclerotinia sclerotiorum (strain ATCC 18683 / 1980 / Ss-1) TaxID=665079 RepID=A7F1G2_SCLS1|nr:predicted protein [Sclerotinia sclerotiorum 1980 UF-70]EDN95554.1 predicted protein [Sclerotinia sclerotiorum 1980 UF-70]